jgi:hypothetical protein
LYSRCDSLPEAIPVYLEGSEQQLLGHADESLGHYADAFSFHLDPDTCKKLSAGHYTYSFEYEHTNPNSKGPSSRVRLNSITLTGRKGYARPVSKRQLADLAEAVVEAA